MKIKKEFILREIADEYILIPTGKTTLDFNGIITLTKTAVFIYEHIEKVKSFDELIQLMQDTYDADKQCLINDTVQFITQMLQYDMIEPDDPKQGW